MHMSLSERTQVLLSPAQRAKVERLSQREQVSVGEVIRRAIDAYDQPAPASRQEALEELFAIEAPVAEWSVMKDEIVDHAS
jgi:hypothetical protein